MALSEADYWPDPDDLADGLVEPIDADYEDIDDDRAAELIEQEREAAEYDTWERQHHEQREREQEAAASRVPDACALPDLTHALNESIAKAKSENFPAAHPVDPVRVSLLLGEMCAQQVTEHDLRERTQHYPPAIPVEPQESVAVAPPQSTTVTFVPHPRLRLPRTRRRGAGRPRASPVRRGGDSGDSDDSSDPEPVAGSFARRRAGCAR